MKISIYYSQKLTLISFVSIIMIVYIHSFYKEAMAYNTSGWLQLFISAINSCAVPIFYFISGLLFFKDIDSYKKCYPKIQKRVKTLLIPFIIWNLAFLGWYLVLELTPGLSNYVNSGILNQIDWIHPIKAFTFIFIKPVGFHLWFLRDLIIFVMLSPFIYFAIKKLKWITLILVFIATGWITRFWLSYFVLGAIIGMSYSLEDTRIINGRYTIIATIIYIASAAISATFDIKAIWPTYILNYISFFTTLCGVISVWGLYDMLFDYNRLTKSSFILEIANFSFFIYLFHEPAFNILKKLSITVFGSNEISLIIFYIINPWIMIAIALSIGFMLKKLTPNIYSILTGGR